MKIGVFDSGIGGYTVLSELINKYPNNHYIYLGDTKNLPYGDKTKQEIWQCMKKVLNFFIKEEIDLFVIACGTVSSNVLTEIKSTLSCPIIDAINPIIEYVNSMEYDKVGIMATSASIKSHIFKHNINTEVCELECPKLVPIIEEKKIFTKKGKKIINNYYDIIRNEECDALILGCTHYPYIKDILKEADNKIDIIYAGKCIINNYTIENISEPKLDFNFTKLSNEIIETTNKVFLNSNYEIKEIKL